VELATPTNWGDKVHNDTTGGIFQENFAKKLQTAFSQIESRGLGAWRGVWRARMEGGRLRMAGLVPWYFGPRTRRIGVGDSWQV
jgi:hypothetical protein